MKVDPAIQIDKPTIKLYNKIMTGIEFMEKYKEDSDIFNPESTNFKNFLIQSFCFLYSDFHYLSFLRKEEVDLEIIKVAGILQILPSNKKIAKLFDDMSKDEIHKFWLKFFSLFKRQDDFTTSSLFNSSCENKISFFKDMGSTLNYLNYEFPVVNMKKFNFTNVDEEIESWKTQAVSVTVASDELSSFDIDEEQAIDTDIDKLIINLKQVLSMYSNQKLVNHLNKPEHVEFFLRFINLTKSILQYQKNLSTINSTFVDDLNMFSAEENVLDYLYFIKRCNNLINTLKSKTKTVY